MKSTAPLCLAGAATVSPPSGGGRLRPNPTDCSAKETLRAWSGRGRRGLRQGYPGRERGIVVLGDERSRSSSGAVGLRQALPEDGASQPQVPSPAAAETKVSVMLKQATAMYAAAAVLGPLCDGQHSSHDVLHYNDPVLLSLDPLLSLETSWWVPLLFGGAGVILGTSHVLLDRLPEADPPVGGKDPSWPFVLASISCFVLQYSASGALEGPLSSTQLGVVPALDAVLAATAFLQWYVFDRTRHGMSMAVLTGAAGPAAEIALINLLGLYHYSHPDFLGIPSWITWVYFCGSPAVGNLGRRVLADLNLQRAEETTQ